MYLKIALRVRSAMFSVIKSNSLHLEIFRFLIQGRRQRGGGGEGQTKGGRGAGGGARPTPFPGGKNFFSCIIGKLKIFTCE